MPSISPLQRRASGSSNISDGVVLLVGIIIIFIFTLGSLAFVGYTYFKKRAGLPNEPGLEREKQETSHPPSRMCSRARITPSIIMPIPAAKREMFIKRGASILHPDVSKTPKALEEANADIIRHHEANDEVPMPFSVFLENFGSDPSALDVPIVEKPPPSLQRLQRQSVNSNFTISVSSGQRRNSLRPDSMSSLDPPRSPTIRHNLSSIDARSSRASFLSAHSRFTAPGFQPPISPFRRHFPLDPLGSPQSHRDSLASSIMSTRSALIFSLNAKCAMQKTALQPFQHLLPDEFDVKIGDKLSLLQTFDDGWCICVAEKPTGLSSSLNEDITMGCVPLWVFERMSYGSPCMREMRGTSLAVTVEIKPTGPRSAGVPWDQTNTISWSNF